MDKNRKHILCLLLSAFGFLFLPLHAQQVEKILDLETSFHLAEQNNQKLLIAKEDVKLAQQRIKEARSIYFPKLGLNLNYLRYDVDSLFILPPDFGSVLLKSPDNATGERAASLYSMRAELKQLLYSGGRTNFTLKLAQANLDNAESRLKELQGELRFTVYEKHIGYLTAKENLELSATAYNEIILLRDDALPPEQKTELQDIKDDFRQATDDSGNKLEEAKLKFLDTLGLELYTSIDVQGKLQPEPVNMDPGKMLAWAKEYRPELKQTQLQEEMDQLGVRLSLAERYPAVTLGAGYEFRDTSFPLRVQNWAANVNFNIPLFDGLSNRARIRQSRIKANQSRYQRAELEDKVTLEIMESYREALYWQEEIEKQKKELSLIQGQSSESRSTLPKAKIYKILLKKQLALTSAVQNQLLSRAKLEQAIGRPLE